MKTEARKPREIATTVEINGSPHGPLHGNFQLSRGIMGDGRGKAQKRLSRKTLVRLSGFAPPTPKNIHEVLNLFLKFYNEMKERGGPARAFQRHGGR
jgi:hypothetical protein